MTIREKLKETWARMCEYEGVPADSKFVIISNDNPHQAEHDKWMSMFLAGERLKHEGLINE